MSCEQPVDTISKYIEFLDSVAQHLEEDPNTYGSALVYRGQSSTSYDLLPSIARNGWRKMPGSEEQVPIGGTLAREADLVESACRTMPQTFNRNMQPIDLLACLQHYGVPTRLLDVTSNALAALYFACVGDHGDGEVFIFCRVNYDKLDYPICQAIADSWQLLASSTALEEFAPLAISRPYFDYQRSLVGRKCPKPAEQACWFKECCNGPMFVHGTRYLNRQTAQSGEYILFPNDIRENARHLFFDNRISPLPKDSTAIAGRCVIPANKKEPILESLRRLGVTQGSLFPDSIDRQCSDVVEAIGSPRP